MNKKDNNIDTTIELGKIYKEILWCRQYNSIIQGINKSSDGSIVCWAHDVRDCCLFKIWNTLFDLLCAKRKMCNLRKVINAIPQDSVLYYDCGVRKDYIRKKDLVDEVSLISEDVSKIASKIKHIYLENEQNIRNQEYKAVVQDKNKKWFDELIDRVETIVRKAKFLNGQKDTIVCFSYENGMYVEKISEVFKAALECVQNTEKSIKETGSSFWVVKAIEKEKPKLTHQKNRYSISITKDYTKWILERYLRVCFFSSAYLASPHEISQPISFSRKITLSPILLHKFDNEFGYDLYSMIVVDLWDALNDPINIDIKKLISDENIKWLADHRNSIAHGRRELNNTIYYNPIKIWKIMKILVLYHYSDTELKQLIWEIICSMSK